MGRRMGMKWKIMIRDGMHMLKIVHRDGIHQLQIIQRVLQIQKDVIKIKKQIRKLIMTQLIKKMEIRMFVIKP